MPLNWLVSYPKSGSTWVRAFLGNFIRDNAGPIDINSELVASPFHLDRHLFDEHTGLASADLLRKELDHHRYEFHIDLPDFFTGTFFSKVHDAYLGRWSKSPIFPADVDVRAIYILRNPLDIVLSYAHHNNTTHDATIAWMNNPYALLSRGEAAFPEYLGVWSQHVRGWTQQTAIKTLVLRFEDLIADPYGSFSNMLAFSDLPAQPEHIERCIAYSSFEVLKNQEASAGFKDRQYTAKSFFREGRAGQGFDALNRDQIDRVYADHGELMDQFGYRPE